MKRTLLTVLVLGASALVVPSAGAASTDVIHGGCYLYTDAQATATSSANVGVIGDLSLTTTGDSPPAPVGATVTCWIEVNGVPAPGTTHSYGDVGGVPGIQAGSDQVSFEATDTDVVFECYSVAYADGSSTGTECPEVQTIRIPPQIVVDLLNQILDAADQLPTPCDLVAETCLGQEETCAVLVALAHDYGPITIEPDGDVYIADPFDLGLNPIYDCSPASL